MNPRELLIELEFEITRLKQEVEDDQRNLTDKARILGEKTALAYLRSKLNGAVVSAGTEVGNVAQDSNTRFSGAPLMVACRMLFMEQNNHVLTNEQIADYLEKGGFQKTAKKPLKESVNHTLGAGPDFEKLRISTKSGVKPAFRLTDEFYSQTQQGHS